MRTGSDELGGFPHFSGSSFRSHMHHIVTILGGNQTSEPAQCHYSCDIPTGADAGSCNVSTRSDADTLGTVA